MSQRPWLHRPKKVEVKPEILRDIRRWKYDSSFKVNVETLAKLEYEEAEHKRLKIAAQLKRIDEEELPDPTTIELVAKIACEICNSKDYLIPSLNHDKIFICDRPNCVYIRAKIRAHVKALKEAINQ